MRGWWCAHPLVMLFLPRSNLFKLGSAILVADVVESQTQDTAYSVTSVDVVTDRRYRAFDGRVAEQ